MSITPPSDKEMIYITYTIVFFMNHKRESNRVSFSAMTSSYSGMS